MLDRPAAIWRQKSLPSKLPKPRIRGLTFLNALTSAPVRRSGAFWCHRIKPYSLCAPDE